MSAISLAYSATAAKAPSVRITYITAQATQGGIVTVRVSVSAGSPHGRTTCSLSVRGPSGASVSLQRQRVLGAARLLWHFSVPANAVPGRWAVTIACVRAGIRRGHFAVVARPKATPADVLVVKSGFGPVPTEGDRLVQYGLVLVNRSQTSDAVNIAVAVDIEDSSGRSLGSDSQRITAIPAKGTFYFGGLLHVTPGSVGPGFTGRLQPTITVGGSQPKRLVLAPIKLSIARVRWSEVMVDVTVTNPYREPMHAAAYVVLFDTQGDIVGSTGPAVSDVDRGHSRSVLLLLHRFNENGSVIAQGSVDPCAGSSLGCFPDMH